MALQPVGYSVLTPRSLTGLNSVDEAVSMLGLQERRRLEPVLHDGTQQRLAAYFVVSEALTNVAKHASATQASVTMTKTGGHLAVEISDDGVGGADIELGTGLRGLTDRLAAIEGRLDVDSKPGRGTTVRASMPCP